MNDFELGFDIVSEGELHRLGASGIVTRQKDHADGVLTRLGQIEIHHIAEERIRQLQQQPRPITRARVCAHSAAVMQTLEDGQTLQHNLVALLPLDMRDKTDAAGIMFVCRVVQSLFWR